MFANRVGLPDYEKVTSEAIKRLEYIISKIAHNLINVFHLDSEEGGSDIELTILRAFLNCMLFFSFFSRQILRSQNFYLFIFSLVCYNS